LTDHFFYYICLFIHKTRKGKNLKALTVKQPWATQIALGIKKIEYRSWATAHRGNLLVCAGKEPFFDDEGLLGPGGVTICTVDLSGI
jgi:hypothetical protein